MQSYVDNRQRLDNLLNELSIHCLKFQHPALETSLDADKYLLERPGTRLKNLFLRDNYGRRHFLVITAYNKSIDLKCLAKEHAISRLGFASDERLKTYLNVQPGCVSMLALMNDFENKVELWIDETLWQSEAFHCHPLINTETYVVQKHDLEVFLNHTQHQPIIMHLPEREAP